jgi:hypothetical protein
MRQAAVLLRTGQQKYLIEIGLKIAKCFRNDNLNDAVGGGQMRHLKVLLPTLLFQRKGLPLRERLASALRHLHLDHFRIGGVVVPAIETDPFEMGILEGDVLQTDYYVLWQAFSAIPNLLSEGKVRLTAL